MAWPLRVAVRVRPLLARDDDGPTSDYTIALILQIVAFLLQIGLYASIQDAGPLAGKIAGKIGMILGILGLLLALVANALSWYHISDIAGAQIMMSAMAEMAAAGKPIQR